MIKTLFIGMLFIFLCVQVHRERENLTKIFIQNILNKASNNGFNAPFKAVTDKFNVFALLSLELVARTKHRRESVLDG